MNRIAKFVVDRFWLVATIVLLAAAVAGLLAVQTARDLREGERLDHLETDAQRRSVEIMSQTLNGNLMGSVAMLGLINPDVKTEALGKLPANNPRVLPALESIGRSYDADGVFVVAENGIIASSWDNAGKPSTNLNVKFRPYYQMAMQGMDNVYAAVSLARGDRSLYYSTPVFSETTNGTQAIGAVVARTGLLKVDNLLRDKADIALMLSPQGVVFASSRPEWIGHLAGTPSPERTRAIRSLKQFGNMFENKEPIILPVTVDTGRLVFENRRYAVASAPVKWNDPFGDWTLVMFEDLDRTVPLAGYIWIGVGTAMLLLLIGLLMLNMLRSHHVQLLTSHELTAYARAQEASAERKSRTAQVAVRLQRAKTAAELAGAFLDETHAILGSLQGVLYVATAGDSLHLAGSYACAEEPPAEIGLGEGLLGQCAVERRLRVIITMPENFAMIRSGLGETAPAAVMIAPVLLNETLLGVVEITLLHAPDAAELEQFEELSKLLAMNIEIVSRNTHTEEILSATLVAEQANAERLAFQQALVDAIPYPVFYKDTDTRFLGFNQAYERTFAVRREDLVGKRVLDLDYLSKPDRIAYQAEDEAVIANVGKVEREMRMTFADGRMHDTLYFVSGFRRPDGQPGGLIGTFIDISDLKQAQNDLERLSDAERFNRLAQGRETRTIELKQEINNLCARLAEAPRYAMAELDMQSAGPASELPLGDNLKLVHLSWHPAYDCGEVDIDREHHTLFAIANDLINAIVAGKAPEAIDQIVNQLVQETTQHFAHEEAILQARGYAQFEAHAAIHRELIDKAVCLVGEFKAGKMEAGPFFQFLVYDVIARHMLGEDRKFFGLFQSDAYSGTAPVVSVDEPSETAHSLEELVDIDELQDLLTSFCASVGIAAAIIDLQGKILAAARWQRACTDFHRTNAESCARCIESDTEFALKLQEGRDFTVYTCKNGMTDAASPIIVEGHHLANVFIGQFHLAPPDMDFFRQQAGQFGYDMPDYLEAVAAAPVMDEKRLPAILGFLAGFARMISTVSLAQRRAHALQQTLRQQADQLQRERIAALSLAEDAEQARLALEVLAKESQA